MDATISTWPEDTKACLSEIEAWFKVRGWCELGCLVLAFVTLRGIMRRKGCLVTCNKEVLRLQAMGKEVFGPETRVVLISSNELK